MDKHPPGAGAYARTLDVRLLPDGDDGTTRVAMTVDVAHLNAFEVLHGGVAMTLLDMVMGAAVTKTIAPTDRTTSVSIHTDFLAAGRPGTLTAKAWLDRRGRTMAFPIGELHDEAGRLIARASGVWAIIPRERGA